MEAQPARRETLERVLQLGAVGEVARGDVAGLACHRASRTGAAPELLIRGQEPLAQFEELAQLTPGVEEVILAVGVGRLY